ncbi:hypothetical protein Q8A73_006602 [Channa argus]|nr:hypothetical protein Q8A73_006602 [Channa argus]
MAFGFTSVYESAMRANAVSQHHCHYRNSNSTVYYDLNEAVCCKNKIHLGAGLSCCGNETFNPSAATCCKANKGGRLTEHVHQGISEKVSACCDANAYDTLNEMCCNSTIVAKPVPKAECCGNKAIDADKQLCCGPNSNKIILNKKTSNSVCFVSIVNVLRIRKDDITMSCAVDKHPLAWHNVEFSVVITPCSRTEKMESNAQRIVFLTTQLKRLYVILSFMDHLENTAVGQKNSNLVLRYAAMGTDIPKENMFTAVGSKRTTLKTHR